MAWPIENEWQIQLGLAVSLVNHLVLCIPAKPAPHGFPTFGFAGTRRLLDVVEAVGGVDRLQDPHSPKCQFKLHISGGQLHTAFQLSALRELGFYSM